MLTLIPAVQKDSFWLSAEPNWTIFGEEGGLHNPHYNEFLRCYCDLDTKSTFAVSVADGLETLLGPSFIYAEGQGPDLFSWCGYEWSADGSSWLLRYGPAADDHWWEIDDLLFGAFSESYLETVNPEDHTIPSPEKIVELLADSSLCSPKLAAASYIEYWHGELTPAQEVALGLTAAELVEEQEKLVGLLN